MSRFSAFHPAVLAVYFVSVLGLAMFCSHPALHLLALMGGILFLVMSGKKPGLGLALLLFLGAALTNPLFSHRGATTLFFFNQNPVTLESILYGVGLGGMLAAVLFWFQAFHAVMTADKLLFLLGRLSPKLSLLLSSALRFTPLLKGQAVKMRESRRAMGLEGGLKGTLKTFSALITWSLENAIDTGAAMKARGYGLKGRSHYSLFRFTAADGAFLAVILLLDAAVLVPQALGRLNFTYYPTLQGAGLDLWAAFGLVAFGCLSLLPAIIEGKELLQWNYCRSKI